MITKRWSARLAALLAAAGAGSAGCREGGQRANAQDPRSGTAGMEAASAASPAAVRSSPSPLVLFVGTSLTAGLGLTPEEAFPALIDQRLRTAGLPHRVVNAGLSGETSAGARRRLNWLLRQHHPQVLVIETGANDGLRGQDTAATRENLQAMIDRARAESPPPLVVLVGMQAPPNYGGDYARRFRALFPDLAARNGVALVPFLLEGVGGMAELNQADGIHPTAEGHRRMADNVWRVLEPLLR